MNADCITISREAGSPGDAIGYELARRLNFTCINKSFVDLVARRARVAPWQVERIERVAPSEPVVAQEPPVVIYREEMGRGLDVLARRLGYGDHLTTDEYVETLRRVIQDLASIGHAVIIGRGAQCVLRERPNTFHIRVLAPHDERVAEVQQTQDVGWAEAEETIETIDGLRAELLRALGCDDINDPALYHLVLKTQWRTVDQCVEEVLARLGAMPHVAGPLDRSV